MRVLLAAALAALVAPTLADQIYTADAVMAPQIMQDDQGYTTCGVRVIVISSKANVAKGAEFSLLLAARPKMGGMFKAGGIRCRGSCTSPDDIKYMRGKDYRLSTVSDGVPLKLIRTFPAEDPEFTLAATDAVAATKYLLATVTGQRMQFAYTPDDSGAREAYTFIAQPLSQEESTSFHACLEGAMSSAREGAQQN